jgi:hypothetical protein
MNPAEQSSFRRHVAHVKFQSKGGRGKAKCDLCEHELASDLHEIIPRSRTIGNVLARDLSFDMYLTSILCHECHLSDAHKDEIQAFLLTKNISLYGIDDVRHKYDLVSNTLKRPLIPFDDFIASVSGWRYQEIRVLYHLQKSKETSISELSKTLSIAPDILEKIIHSLIESGEIGILGENNG